MNIVAIFSVERNKKRLWYRIVRDEYGVLAQIFAFEPDELTPAWEALTVVGVDFHDGLLATQMWDKEALLQGGDPKRTELLAF